MLHWGRVKWMRGNLMHARRYLQQRLVNNQLVHMYSYMEMIGTPMLSLLTCRQSIKMLDPGRIAICRCECDECRMPTCRSDWWTN